MKKNNLFMGFVSFNDFVNSLLGLKHWFINAALVCFAMITTFITDYIWDSYQAVYFMAFALFIDTSTGIIRSIRNKAFSSARLPRSFVILLCYCIMLCLAWNAAKHSILFIWLPSAVYGGIIGTLLISIIENLVLLNILDKTVFEVIINKLKTIFKKKE